MCEIWMLGEEGTPHWTPKKSPSALELAEQARTRGSEGIYLRNDSNAFWGRVLAWGLIGIAGILLNPTFEPPRLGEALAYASALFGVSVTSMATLGRSHVRIHGGDVHVRNPLMQYSIPLASVDALERGALGFTILRVGGRRLRVYGLEETLLDRISRGSEEVQILEKYVKEARRVSSSNGSGTFRATLRFFDFSLALLVAGWLAFGVGYFIWSRSVV